jgi:fructose-1,6-bisphosphatase I
MAKRKGITVSRQIMDTQLMHPHATGGLTGLLNDLVVAGKIISAEVNMAGLADILGQSGKTNIQGESVQKLDVFANQTIKRRMEQCGYICVMASEEDEVIIPVLDDYAGDYTIAFDPLDGSSNIDVNVNVGTIFSIHRRLHGKGQGCLADLLQKGSEQVAAGYIMYGSSTMMVYTTGHGVHGFTLDPSVGEFFLSHPNIRTPDQGKVYSVNEAYSNYWFDATRGFINSLKDHGQGGNRYSLRYIGSLVADFHRNLIKGGIFLYPRDKKSSKQTEGKLRLLYEAAPLAMLIEQAGGRAITDDGRRILDIEPRDLHQRVPLIIGSKNDVDLAERFLLEQRR